jgi:hypothetical protein
MRELVPADFQRQRLSDEDILEIFRNLRADGCPRCVFLEHYADALAAAPRRDFMMLRPASLILIAKYKLAEPRPAEGVPNGHEQRAG